MVPEAPGQGVEMSHRTNKAGGPLYLIGAADEDTQKKKEKRKGKSAQHAKN